MVGERGGQEGRDKDGGGNRKKTGTETGQKRRGREEMSELEGINGRWKSAAMDGPSS